MQPERAHACVLRDGGAREFRSLGFGDTFLAYDYAYEGAVRVASALWLATPAKELEVLFVGQVYGVCV